MFKISHCLSKSQACRQQRELFLRLYRQRIQQESTKSDISSPPTSGKKSGGFFWKFLGVSLVSAGGVVGYAWYDPEFKKTIESNVPYSKDAFNLLFSYLPPAPVQQKPTLEVSRDKMVALGKASESVKKEQKAPETKTPEPVKPAESKKELAAREAREKKEKAQEALRRREEEEAAQNLALETGLETLLANVTKSVNAAIAAQQAAATAIRAHTDQLKAAMQENSTESHWESLTDSQQLRADAVWTADQTANSAKDALEKLRRAVTDGHANKTTKKNKILTQADKDLNKFNYDFNSSVAELTKARSEAKVFSEYRQLVKKGKEQFKRELEEAVPEVSIDKSKGGKLSTDELNALIAHAHRRIDQLQRRLLEQLAMEPLRVDAALASQQREDELLADEQVSREQLRAKAELDELRQTWEADARVEFESELRHQLSRQAAAHSDHLVDVLRAQRVLLDDEFGRLFTAAVSEERDELQSEVAGLAARMRAIESTVNARAERQRSGCHARDLWLACNATLTVIRGHPGLPRNASPATDDKPVAITNQLDAVRAAGSEFPFVHVAMAAIPPEARRRGIYTPDVLARRFQKVRGVARRVAMVDETGGSPVAHLLSYVQSIFVLRSRPARPDSDVSSLSTFQLLDNAEYSLRRGDLEQATRFVSQLSGEARHVASDWLNEARLFLETKQAIELLLAFASANGLGSLS